MCGRRMLSSKKFEQVKRVLRESTVLLLRSPRCNGRIGLAFGEVLHPGNRPDTRTAGTVYVSQSPSSLRIWQCVSGLFSSPNWQYQNSVNIGGWSLRRSLLNCGWLPIGGGKLESVNKSQPLQKEENTSYTGGVTGLRVSSESAARRLQMREIFALLVEADVIVINATLCCHKAWITALCSPQLSFQS